MAKTIDNTAIRQRIVDYRNGDKSALDEITKNCKSLIKSMSRKYSGTVISHNLEFKDLEQECYIALIGAVNNFPLDSPDAYFSSFAATSMDYQILRYFHYNTNRIVRSDHTRGSANLQSFEVINDDTNPVGKIEDSGQRMKYSEIEDDIDRELQRKVIDAMLDDLIPDEASFLKDVYGLSSGYLSWNELCEKYNLPLKELLAKERVLIHNISTNKKAETYIEKLDYSCRDAYHYGLQRFKETGMSSTEYLVLQHMEHEEKLQERGE